VALHRGRGGGNRGDERTAGFVTHLGCFVLRVITYKGNLRRHPQ